MIALATGNEPSGAFLRRLAGAVKHGDLVLAESGKGKTLKRTYRLTAQGKKASA